MSKPAWALGARSGPVRPFINLKVFACEGLVVIIDERPGKTEGEYTVVTPRDLQMRVFAINRTYRGQGRMDMPKWQRLEYDQQRAGSQNCMEAIKEAKFMGDPSDPAVQAFWAKHRRNTKISFSASVDAAGYIGKLPEVPCFSGLNSPTVVADEMTIHVPPRKKNRGKLLLD